jgi:hypothetical protein
MDQQLLLLISFLGATSTVLGPAVGLAFLKKGPQRWLMIIKFDRLVLGGFLSRVLVDFLRFVAIISGIVLAAGAAQAMSNTALLSTYCAAFWQSIVDDYEELIQGLPSSPRRRLDAFINPLVYTF